MQEKPPPGYLSSTVSGLRPVRWRFRDVDGKVLPCSCPLAAWGSPTTPLLPSWHRNAFAKVQLPPSVRTLAPALATVGDLGDFWEHVSGPVSPAALRMLVDLVGGGTPDPDLVIVAKPLIEDAVKHWPLRVRTKNCLVRLHRTGAEEDLTAGTLLDLQGFGIASLIDIMCLAEAAEQTFDQQPGSTGRVLPSRRKEEERPAGETHPEPSYLLSLLLMLFAAVSDFQPARTLGDALRADLGSYVDALGIHTPFDDIDLRDVTGGLRITQGLLNALLETTNGFDDRDRTILNARLYTSTPTPMRHVGEDLGITAERVRQLGKRIAGEIEASTGRLVEGIATLIEQRLGHITTPESVRSAIRRLFDAPDEATARLACRIIKHSLSYIRIGDYYFDEPAIEMVDRLRQHAEDLMDDVGLVSEDALLSAMSASEWRDHRKELTDTCSLVPVSGFLARRNTAKARIKAALHHIGRPATRQEIAEHCGLDPRRLGSHLSMIPSAARADKNRWGLTEWMEDVYEGIPAEIRKRVEQNGGEVPLSSLLDELPNRFGVKANSVITYVGSAQFDLRNGQVTIADPSTVPLRSLDKVIAGRDERGNPYWDFVVHARYFEGYSLLGLPPEIAEVLGCGPDQKIKVSVATPAGANDLSVIWRLSSVTGASVGYLAEPLRMIEAEDGDRVRMIMNSDGTVSLHLIDDGTDPAQTEPVEPSPLFG